jgi:hypothetical protein
MLLAYAGFTGLAGCFVPIKSRAAALPTNVGFVAGQHSFNGLQGNGSATINCGIGFTAGQQDNHVAGTCGNAGTLGRGGHFSNRSATSDGITEIYRSVLVVTEVIVRSSGLSASVDPFSPGTCLINRTGSNTAAFINNSTVIAHNLASEGPRTTNMQFFILNSTNISDRRAQMGFFGDALPNPSAFSSAVGTLMAALGVTP